MIKVTDKRRDDADAISIREKEFGERAAEDRREDGRSQAVFFHLGGWSRKRGGEEFGCSVGSWWASLLLLRFLPYSDRVNTALGIIYERTEETRKEH